MPRIVVVDPRAPDLRAMDEAAALLRLGKLVAFPTETVYGLGARALDERAVVRVFFAKGRPASHPLIAHVSSVDDARRLATSWPDAATALAKAFWPGPLTLVVERAAAVPAANAAGGDSLAIRAPAHPVARALLRALGEPIAAPSANRYQGVSPTLAAHVVKELGDSVDLVVDGGACDAGIESTVVDVRRSPPRVLRPGAVPVDALRAVLPDVEVAVQRAAADEARPSPGMDARHYAPRARLVLAEGPRAIELAWALALRGERVGLIVRARGAGDPGPGVLLRPLGERADEYARGLYATLHELDDAGVAAIVVERVPDGDAWRAVADRLARASEA